MSKMNDTLYRQITLLKLIPRYPRKITTPDLVKKINESGFNVTQRTLQRDLSGRLSILFPLICDDSEKPYRWSFRPEIQLDLPSMDTTTALAFYLAEQQLVGQLPQTVVEHLQPQFDNARVILGRLQENNFTHWIERVRAIPNGKTLIPANIDATVWQETTSALLEKKCLKVSYLSRASETIKQFILHPYGLVSRFSSSYLVARVGDYQDLRQFALHRIKEATATNVTADVSEDFVLDQYIAKGAFSGAFNANKVELVADISPQVAWLLQETPLSTEQTINPLNDGSGWYQLTAKVQQDQETLWWIYGLNRKIKLHQPAEWVEEITQTAEFMIKEYATSERRAE